MANTDQAIITDDGHNALAQSFGGPSGGFSWSYGQYFKLGVGGFIIVSGCMQPANPDPTLHDIQASTSGMFWYRKTFTPSDFLFIAPGGIQVRCFMDTNEGNGISGLEPDTPDDQDGPKNSITLGGNAPTYLEVGIFDLQDVMVAYGTFPGEGKLSTKTLNHLVLLTF